MPKSSEKAGTFEKDLERLEDLVRELESGRLTLDETFERYEEGVKLARACRTRLESVERRIEELLPDGSVRTLEVT